MLDGHDSQGILPGSTVGFGTIVACGLAEPAPETLRFSATARSPMRWGLAPCAKMLGPTVGSCTIEKPWENHGKPPSVSHGNSIEKPWVPNDSG